MKIEDVKYVYCIGLGGVGVSAVAKYFLARGVKVVGADPQKNPFVEDIIALGGEWYSDHDAARITPDIDLVVYTDDCRPDHPERQAATALQIPTQNFSETLGEIMRHYRQAIAIAGTNGKSTTTALAALLLRDAGQDPTIFVGSRIRELDSNYHDGSKEFFVAEADEYHDHFLNLAPRIGVITNIELDHVDYFPTMDRLVDSFRKFGQNIPAEGALIVNGDDPVIAQANFQHRRIVRFGTEEHNDLRITDTEQADGRQYFSLSWQGQQLGPYIFHRPSSFNIMNAAAAAAAVLSAGISSSTFARTLERFSGIWRRFEILNPGKSVTIVDDYAHHPTAVSGTLAGAKTFFPGRRIVAVFQPHHRNRLTALFREFADAFADADETIIVETYAVPGRDHEEADMKSAADLVQALSTRGNRASYALTITEAQNAVERMIKPRDVVIIMGAGPIWTIAQPLADRYQ